MIRAHEAIPVVEVETIVATHLFVMLDMIGRRVDELADPRFHQPVRVVFIAHMTKDIEGDLPDHEDQEGKWVHRKSEDQEREDRCLHSCF